MTLERCPSCGSLVVGTSDNKCPACLRDMRPESDFSATDEGVLRSCEKTNGGGTEPRVSILAPVTPPAPGEAHTGRRERNTKTEGSFIELFDCRKDRFNILVGLAYFSGVIISESLSWLWKFVESGGIITGFYNSPSTILAIVLWQLAYTVALIGLAYLLRRDISLLVAGSLVMVAYGLFERSVGLAWGQTFRVSAVVPDLLSFLVPVTLLIVLYRILGKRRMTFVVAFVFGELLQLMLTSIAVAWAGAEGKVFVSGVVQTIINAVSLQELVVRTTSGALTGLLFYAAMAAHLKWRRTVEAEKRPLRELRSIARCQKVMQFCSLVLCASILQGVVLAFIPDSRMFYREAGMVFALMGLAVVGAGLTLFVFGVVLAARIQGLIVGIVLGVVMLLPCVIVALLLTMDFYATFYGIPIGLRMLLGCIDLITLLAIDCRATKILRGNGYRVGLFGVRLSDFHASGVERSSECEFRGGKARRQWSGSQRAEEVTVRQEDARVLAVTGEHKAIEKGIEILLSGGAGEWTDVWMSRVVAHLKPTGREGSRALSKVIRELIACRSRYLKVVLEIAGELECCPEIVDAIRYVATMDQREPVGVFQTSKGPMFLPEISDGRVGDWTDAGFQKLKKVAGESLAKLCAGKGESNGTGIHT